MATTRNASYVTMLNEYLPNKLLNDELIKRDWFFQNVQKDMNWLGGDSIVPFKGAGATSVKFGGLTAEANITQHKYVRGKMSGYKEAWGSLIFDETDLMQHGKISEQNFLRLLPDQLEDFMTYMKMVMSINLMSGPHFAKITSVANANVGVIVVDKIDRFEIGQLVDVSDNTGVAEHFETLYVIAININTNAITLSLTATGAAADLTAAGAAFNGVGISTSFKCYHDGILASGVVANGFTTLSSGLLSVANGGLTNLHGVAKTAYPYLQAVNIDGSAIDATNILDKLFDAWTEVKIRAKASNPSKCVMSFKNLGTIMKLVETDKSPFKVTATQTSASLYNWTEVNITGVRGGFNIVGIQEMDDDLIYFLDMSAFTLRSNGGLKKVASPEGIEYTRVRATTGFKLITDICFMGDLELTAPAKCAVIHTVAY